MGGARLLQIPLYADHLGASRATVGLLFSTFTITAALLSIPAGVLADRFGKRNLVVFSVLAFGASQVLAGTTNSVAVLFLTQLIGGLGGGAAQTAILAALADAVPAHRLGRSMGWLTLAMQTGFLAGPAAAGILLHWLTLQQDILVTTAPAVVALVLAIGWVSSTGAARGARIDVAGPLLMLSRRPGFYGVLISLFAATVLWGTYQAYIPLFGIRGLGLTGTAVGYLLAIQAVVNGATRVPAGRLLDRIGRPEGIVAVSIVGFGAGLLVLPHLHGFLFPAILLVATIPLVATAFVAIGILFVHMAPVASRGAAMGVYSTILFLGLGAGPAIFAPLMNRSYVLGFTVCGIAGAGLAAAALLGRPATPPAAELAETG